MNAEPLRAALTDIPIPTHSCLVARSLYTPLFLHHRCYDYLAAPFLTDLFHCVTKPRNVAGELLPCVPVRFVALPAAHARNSAVSVAYEDPGHRLTSTPLYLDYELQSTVKIRSQQDYTLHCWLWLRSAYSPSVTYTWERLALVPTAWPRLVPSQITFPHHPASTVFTNQPAARQLLIVDAFRHSLNAEGWDRWC